MYLILNPEGFIQPNNVQTLKPPLPPPPTTHQQLFFIENCGLDIIAVAYHVPNDSPGCVDNGATEDNILRCELAGDEAGMMKCLFVVEIRALTCRALCADSLQRLQKCLEDNDVYVADTTDVRQACEFTNLTT